MKTESNVYPKIQRSRKEGMIFFPNNIQEVQREDMDGKKEIFYEYDLIKIPDKGRQIEDYKKFRLENYAELRKQAYGPWQEQFELMQEKGVAKWVVFCQGIKKVYPKNDVGITE